MLFFSRFFPKTFAYKAFFCSYAQNDDVFPLLLYVKEEVARQPLSDTCLIIRLKYQRLKFYKQLVVHHLRSLPRPYKANTTLFWWEIISYLLAQYPKTGIFVCNSYVPLEKARGDGWNNYPTTLVRVMDLRRA